VGLENGPSSADESKRTPMPWTSSGGFTTGTPWHPYSPGLATVNVTAQTNDGQSLLSYYRNWISARKHSSGLMKGNITLLETGTQVLAFLRDSGEEQVLVLHNLGDSAIDTGPLPVKADRLDAIHVDTSVGAPAGGANAWRVVLPPHSSGAWRVR
jgi:alpha-amylase